jgi:hypothetical protein
MLDPKLAESRGARKVVARLADLADNVESTRYQGRIEVKESRGVYNWDCSGMATWILRRDAPRALRSIHSSRPLARDFFRAIERAPLGKQRRGWQRLAHVSEVRPGDLFAWLRSPISTSNITGHVGFVVSTPKQVSDSPPAYLVRIADATSLPHQRDTREYEGEGGFGFGTILFVNDDAEETVAYGWFGAESSGLMPARVIYGRVHR